MRELSHTIPQVRHADAEKWHEKAWSCFHMVGGWDYAERLLCQRRGFNGCGTMITRNKPGQNEGEHC